MTRNQREATMGGPVSCWTSIYSHMVNSGPKGYKTDMFKQMLIGRVTFYALRDDQVVLENWNKMGELLQGYLFALLRRPQFMLNIYEPVC